MIPLLTFGIPGSNSAAIMLAAMLLHGIQAGPQLFERTPQIVYGLFVGMFVANLMMLGLGFLSLRPAIAIVNIPRPLLLAGILGLVLVGAYSISNRMFEVWVVLLTGLAGYGMRRYGLNVLAAVLGLVLGFMVVAVAPGGVPQVVDRVRHRRYGKTLQKTRKFYAHDETNDAREGDRVRIAETRPLSRNKRWRLVEVLERAR